MTVLDFDRSTICNPKTSVNCLKGTLPCDEWMNKIHIMFIMVIFIFLWDYSNLRRQATNVCLFVLGFSSHSRIFHSYGVVTITGEERGRAANFDLCSALMVIEQWGFFSVPHLLWHWAFVYNGLRRHMTLAPFAERLSVELSLYLRFLSVAAWIRTPNLPLAG